MAKIAPFRGVRYNSSKAGELSKTVAPPYDVIDAEELEQLRARSEHNVVHIDLPNADQQDDLNPYTKAGEMFRTWLENNIMQKDDKPAIYAYTQKYTIPGTNIERNLTGFIAAVKLVRWDERIILPHEHTFAKPKEDRLHLMRAGKANFSQVYAFYSDPQLTAERALTKAMEQNQPDMAVHDDDGAEHNVWVVDAPDIVQAVVESLDDKTLYIADGHHRYETALDYRDELRGEHGEQPHAGHEYVMMMIVNAEDDGLTVLPTHRMVQLPHQVERSVLREQLAPFFSIVEFDVTNGEETAARAASEISDHADGMTLVWRDVAWSLVPHDRAAIRDAIQDDASNAWKDLGVTVLHRVVLEQAFQMERALQEDGEHITYTRDAKEAIDSVLQGNSQLACIVNAPSPQDIMEVAEENDSMPQKSTYFYPKLLTGLVLNDLTEPVGS